MLAGVTLHNFLFIGLMASVFIVAFKAMAGRSKVGGLQTFANAI